MQNPTNNPDDTRDAEGPGVSDTDHAVLESIRAIVARYGASRLSDLRLVNNAGAGMLVRRPAWLDDDRLWNAHAAALRPWWDAILQTELARWKEANR